MKKLLQVYTKTIDNINLKPVNLYQQFVKNNKGFLLESYSDNVGRYSFIARNPKEKITSNNNSIIIEKENDETITIAGNPIDTIKSYMETFDVLDTTDLTFTGGLVGVFGYDFIRFSEKLPDINKDTFGIEAIQLWLVYDLLVYDHKNNNLTIVTIDNRTAQGEISAAQRLNSFESEILSMIDIYTCQKEKKCTSRLINKTDTMDTFVTKVNKAKQYIKEGDIFQVVLSQRWTIETDEDGLSLYRDLRELNPSPYLYYFNFIDFEIIGSSPEMLVKKVGSTVYNCPIAGTRKRGKTQEEDELLKHELLEDEKECAEHVMLVDLARNDMGKIAKFDSVKVTQFMQVQNYSHVMHIESMVEGQNNYKHPLDILASFLPAGTLSGAPKIRAMEIIEELEEVKRGPYGGAIGYIGFNKNLDFCITIRTMIKKDNMVALQAGAGIVADSDPEKEYEECYHKVKVLSKVLKEEGDLIDFSY